MDIKELVTALGLDGEENKDKVEVLTKEFTAKTREVNSLTKKLKTAEEEQTKLSEISKKFDIVAKAYSLDLEAEDFDKMLDDVKDKMVKEAGGGTTPEEVKIIKRDLTKAQRELEAANKSVTELTAQLESEKTQRINAVKRDKIQKALVANKVIKPEQMIDLFFGKVEVDKDGSTLTMKDSAGNEISLDDGIADWAKENPEFVKTETKGGLGSNGSSSFGNTNGEEMSDFMKSIIADKQSSYGGDKNQTLASLFG